SAIEMARHLLGQYPKCINGYRLLSQAALERGDYHEAGDLFRRVLSADPEDFIARAGLALVYRQEGALDEAIWQMLRAYELVPGNAEVREHLRQLFEERDDRAPGRFKLNSAGLARIYMRDGWYERAADELRAQLDAEPDRVDLRVALVECLWRAGQRGEAAETAAEVLQELPYCLKANLLLGQALAEEGDSELAWQYLHVAQALDPENAVAQRLFGMASYLPRYNATIVPLNNREGPASGGEEEFPDWLYRISLDDEGGEGTGRNGGQEWRADLRSATNEALEQWEPERPPIPGAYEALEFFTPPAPEESLPPAISAPSPFDRQAVTSPQDHEWVAALRVATRQAVDEWDVAPAVEQADWRAALVEATRAASSAVMDTERPGRSLRPARSESAPDWREGLASATRAMIEEAARAADLGLPAGPVPDEQATAQLALAARDALLDLPAGEPVMLRADALHWRDWLADATRLALAEAWGDAGTTQPAPEPDGGPAVEVESGGPAAIVELPAAEPVELDARLQEADALRLGGESERALALYQALYEAGRFDEPLIQRLLPWTEGGAAPGVHELLGHLYRRRGQAREAIAQYRAAINGMVGET
ncbi:MAG TPA: tetratricopeptide repeat protein, partial [Ardenticatenaceae bacterium]|nr:tetratricopeptide repeat protein [Ardenticatenaceae bacterium]